MDTAYTHKTSTLTLSQFTAFCSKCPKFGNSKLNIRIFFLEVSTHFSRLHRTRSIFLLTPFAMLIQCLLPSVWQVNSSSSCMVSTNTMVFCEITFPCFCEGFARIHLNLSCALAVLTRYSETLKCSTQYRRDHESGAGVRRTMFSEYVAVVNFSFIKLCKRSSSNTFCSVF